MKARQRKKNYKKIHGYNPPKAINYNHMINSIIEAIPKVISTVKKWISDMTEIIDDGIKNIKEMSEEEFNEKITNSDFTLEQIAMVKMIRYGRKKSQ